MHVCHHYCQYRCSWLFKEMTWSLILPTKLWLFYPTGGKSAVNKFNTRLIGVAKQIRDVGRDLEVWNQSEFNEINVNQSLIVGLFAQGAVCCQKRRHCLTIQFQHQQLNVAETRLVWTTLRLWNICTNKPLWIFSMLTSRDSRWTATTCEVRVTWQMERAEGVGWLRFGSLDSLSTCTGRR